MNRPDPAGSPRLEGLWHVGDELGNKEADVVARGCAFKRLEQVGHPGWHRRAWQDQPIIVALWSALRMHGLNPLNQAHQRHLRTAAGARWFENVVYLLV